MPPIKPTTTEDKQYVSPTSDETPEERYQRITEAESHLTEAELQEKIDRLEAPSEWFDWEENE
jgi:hypothetical protein